MSYQRMPLRRVVVDACDGPFGSSLKSEHYADTGARVVRLGNIGGGEWLDGDVAFLPLDYWATLPRHHAVAGDLLVAGLGDERHSLGRACVLPEVGPALVKADCYRLRVDLDAADPHFLALFLSSAAGEAEALRLADGATRSRLTLGKALSIPIPAISVGAQRAITGYLDAEIAAVDALVAVLGESIDLLVSRRRALIATAVSGTRSARSGYITTRIKHLVSVRAGAWGLDPGVDELDVHCVRAADFDRGHLRVSPGRLPLRSYGSATARQLLLRRGDIVLEKSGGGAGQPVGGTALFDLESPAVCSNFAARLRPAPNVHPEYLNYLLASLYWTGLTESLAKQTTGISNLDVGAYLSTPVSVPPTVDQRLIAVRLDRETSALDALVETRQRQANLLLERRQAIITAAVTGQLELPGVAA